MPCRRCGGLMIVELFDDVKEYAIPSEAPGTRCVNCGNIEDAVIYANRVGPPSRRRTARYDITTEVEDGLLSSCIERFAPKTWSSSAS